MLFFKGLAGAGDHHPCGAGKSETQIRPLSSKTGHYQRPQVPLRAAQAPLAFRSIDLRCGRRPCQKQATGHGVIAAHRLLSKQAGKLCGVNATPEESEVAPLSWSDVGLG
jgi:hypothetical protein